jgi:hypothetical protein
LITDVILHVLSLVLNSLASRWRIVFYQYLQLLIAMGVSPSESTVKRTNLVGALMDSKLKDRRRRVVQMVTKERESQEKARRKPGESQEKARRKPGAARPTMARSVHLQLPGARHGGFESGWVQTELYNEG